MSAAQNYIQDVLALLLERAREAKANYASARTQHGEKSASFEAGRAAAYYEVISTLVNQLEPFGLSAGDVGLASDIDIDKLLL